MTVSRQPQITEELLSAYLDDQVTAEERALVEESMATDPAIAWQVDSLRQTVHLLQALPPLALPRALSLEAILAEAHAAEAPAPLQAETVVTNAPQQPVRRTVVRSPIIEKPETNWWQWFLHLWQGGNLQLRNAAAVALTLFFVLFAGDRFLVATRPIAEITSTAVPAVATNAEPTVVEQPVAPAAAMPTATNAPITVEATAVVNSDNQADGGAPNNATAATTFAETAVQPEDNARSPQGITSSAPGGLPGPVEEVLNPNGAGNADESTAQSLRTTESGERNMMAKSTLPPSDAVAAATTMTQQYGVTTTSPSTASELAIPMSATVTSTEAISVTPTVAVTQTVIPTVTMASATPFAGAMPTGKEGVVWLTWAQMITALSTVVLASLWWRSRR